MEQDGFRNGFSACYNFPFGIGTGISTRYQHHGNCSARVDFQRQFPEVALGRGHKQRHQVGSYAEHNHFCFGVAHTHIVFYHHRFPPDIDKAEENKAAIVNATAQKPVDSGTHYALLNLRHKGSIGKRHGAYSTHTAGIKPGVAFAYTFVILCNGKDAVAPVPVGKHEHRALYPFQELFNHHCGRRSAEHARKHLFQFMARLIQSVENQDTLPGGKSVGLEDIRGIQCLKETVSLLKGLKGETAVAGGGDIVIHHKLFCKILAPFKHGTGLFRPYHKQCGVVGPEIIGDTGNQRILVADNEQFHMVLGYEFFNGGEIERRKPYVFTISISAAVARGNKEFVS